MKFRMLLFLVWGIASTLYPQTKFMNSLHSVMVLDVENVDVSLKPYVETVSKFMQYHAKKTQGLKKFEKKVLGLYSREIQIIKCNKQLHSVVQMIAMQMYYAFLKNAAVDVLNLAKKAEFAERYWQHELYEEQKPLYKKNILRWLNRLRYQRRIKKYLEGLEKLRPKIFYYLGMLQTVLHHFEQSTNYEQCKNAFDHDMQQYQTMYEESYDFIDDIDTILNLQVKVMNVIDGFGEECRKVAAPHHIVRHWFKYMTGTALVGAGALFVHKNHHKFDEWVERGQERVQRFYVDHVQDPLQKIKKSLFEEEESKITAPEFVPFDVSDKGPIVTINHPDKKLVQGQLDEMYRHEIKEKLKSDRGWREIFASEPTDEEVDAMMQNKKLLQDLDVEHLKAFIYSPNGAIRAVTRQALRLKKEGYDFLDDVIKTVENIDQNLELNKIKTNINALMGTIQQLVTTLEEERVDQKLNLQIAALLPACVLVYGCGSLMASGYHKLFKKNFAHNPMKRAVRRIEIVLNGALHQEKTFEVEGQLYFYIHSLQDFMSIVSSEQEMRFYQDIKDLNRYDLTYEQKYNVIQRMYHTYYFLLPGAV